MSTQETTTSSGAIPAPTQASIPEAGGRHREVLGLLAASGTVLLVLALWSYGGQEDTNLVGPVGTGLAGMLIGALGVAAWLLPFELAAATWRIFRGRPALLGVATVASTLAIALLSCAILHLAFDGGQIFGDHLAGGLLGEILGELIRSLFGLWGAFIVAGTMLMVTLVLRTHVSVIAAVRKVGTQFTASKKRMQDGWAAVADAWEEARQIEQEELARLEVPVGDVATWDELTHGNDGNDKPDNVSDESINSQGDQESNRAANTLDGALENEDSFENEDSPEELGTSTETEARDSTTNSIANKATPTEAEKSSPPSHEPTLEDLEQQADVDVQALEATRKKRAVRIVEDKHGPTIVPPRVEPQTPREPQATQKQTTQGTFHLPPLDLLERPPSGRIRIDPEVLRDNARRLEEKLESYGVRGRVDEIHPGPVVTMYEFEPESGIKISKIAGLENDLALALAAQKVRIVAPIPGKARVGIELPNDNRQMVYLRSILEDDRWDKHKGALPMALGKDIAGQPVYADLAKMPHLLVAGATGAGKSVGLNVMLASLLAKKTPEEVRMLMIDPKVVELAVFDDIPHMLLPVVTDMQNASLALKWAVDEMERRYQLFADAGSRNITTFNQKVERVLRGELHPEKMQKKKRGKTDEEVEAPIGMPEKLPYIVVVVDEFADLMMVAAKEVESAVARLAQKARAAGIHVILATQRPSVDVITGMIKANFPARMAFKVSQNHDSKTILGRTGAENLLGKGDMLMLPPGSSDLARVHCAFIGEDEVTAICDHLRAQGEPDYDEEILKPREESEAEDNSDNPLYDRAIAIVATAGYCSISHLQRKLGIGYNKAATLVEQLEEDGVVGPPSSAAGGRREVFVQPM